MVRKFTTIISFAVAVHAASYDGVTEPIAQAKIGFTVSGKQSSTRATR